ncbi:MAG TPA: hypothetical protein VI488_09065 [Candidatus Angelobacter sp.]
MSQIFHIFRKDVRHHWIEILVCQAALVAFCWNEVRGWRERIDFRLDILSTVVGVLLPFTWGFLVFRAVHSETLVGDRQFWITRPYEWKKLLAEKILIVLVFLNLPLLIAGAALLIKAGFSPWPHVLGLLWMQLLLIQLPFLPLMALAAVTRNLAQGLLALLAVVLYMIGMAALDGALTYLGFPSGDADVLQGLAIVIVCVVAIGLQYAQRQTGRSRAWLAAGAVAAVLVMLGNAYYLHGKDKYPLPAIGQLTSFHADLDPVHLSAPKEPPEKDEDVNFAIPLRAWGLTPDSLGRVRGVRITLKTPDGFRWDSDWQGYYSLLSPKENHWRQDFSMKYKIYERLKSAPVKARVSVAVEVFREHDLEVITAGNGEFDVPGVGRCRVRDKDASTLRCHSPLVKPPTMVVVRVDPAASTCTGQDKDQQTREGVPYAWEDGSNSNLPDYGISPVESFQFYFFSAARICPGTPLSFSFPKFTENTRADFDIATLNLDEYRTSSAYGSFVIGVGPRRR